MHHDGVLRSSLRFRLAALALAFAGSTWSVTLDPSAARGNIVINEILTHTDLPQLDAIELFNPTSTNVNLAGWFLSDDAAQPKKLRIPNGTVIATGIAATGIDCRSLDAADLTGIG